MKQLALVLALIGTLAVWIADLLLLSVPAFRNGWWTLALFAFPAAMLALGTKGPENRKLKIAAWAFFALSFAGWLAWRFVGKIEGTPAVAPGQRAPNFTLKDQDGKDVSLSDFTGERRVVLVFFRSRWCAVCRASLRGLLSRWQDFVDSKVEILAVGPVTPEEAKGFGLPFKVLSDPDLEVTKTYGLFHSKGFLGKDAPRPAAILIDKERTVRWIRAEDDYRTRYTPDEIFEELRK